MNKKDREVLAVVGISVALALAVSLFAVFDPEYVEGELVWYVLAVVWAFGAPSAYVVAFRWFRTLSLRTAFYLGWILGLLFFLLPLLISPFLAVYYYISALRGGRREE